MIPLQPTHQIIFLKFLALLDLPTLVINTIPFNLPHHLTKALAPPSTSYPAPYY